MGPPFDQITAYHEAGHAVVALALGRPVLGLSVLPRRQHLGVCEYHKGAFRPSENWLKREALIALGGVAAEARHTGTYAWDNATRDQEHVRSLAVRRAGERASARPSAWNAACWPTWSIFSERKGTGGRWN